MMQLQKSFFHREDEGVLYLVPTPIGNLEDMTFRAVRILKECDIIAAEDTRQTKKLCHYFEINTPIISYHEHNKEHSGSKILKRLQSGQKVALVSDAGMPTISDPGSELVKQVIEEGFHVIPLPGANAALTALIASGIDPNPFYFYGFLNRQKKEKKKQLEVLKHRSETVILYESPHRLKETLELLHEIFGNRYIVLCRELTKKYEEFIRGTISECIAWVNEHEMKGEFCIIIEGSKENDLNQRENHWWSELTIIEHIENYMEKGFTSKDAIKQVAKDRNVSKREIYQAYHIDKEQ
ncbi:16S rRNA (cytidine(1402)-2'-O)-methyltransferase [Bacillus alveayuensis]|uniref:16S rRNA (cytidine(1402)-2'-O)-methyltransferase n=1 Tax=Aeribacillus alveayuensis TaxID=279215 RepID=UPI0005D0FF9D|nr:16S rRNA (cytidine(1402)-2'-O)-methyltransferase [Bacillus alveayuensis]